MGMVTPVLEKELLITFKNSTMASHEDALIVIFMLGSAAFAIAFLNLYQKLSKNETASGILFLWTVCFITFFARLGAEVTELLFLFLPMGLNIGTTALVVMESYGVWKGSCRRLL
jgi:hypothetical protein